MVEKFLLDTCIKGTGKKMIFKYNYNVWVCIKKKFVHSDWRVNPQKKS